MQKIFKCLRYVIFGIFIVCNAAVTSFAVWNHSLYQSIAWSSQSQLDIYLAFVGCLGLVLIFPLIFIELSRKDFVTGRVWFECLWVCLFWMLYLAGATALTAISPNPACQISAHVLRDNECTSLRAMMAFTWIVTVILLLYLSLLFVLSLMHSRYDPTIWHRYIRKSPWSGSRQTLSSAPTSPSRPHFLLNKSPSIMAPKPQRAVPPAMYAYRSGLSEYEIEHYHPSTPAPVVAAPPPAHLDSNLQVASNPIPSLYPQFMHSTVTTPSSFQDGQHVNNPPSPPPLGNWPRPNIVMEPVRSKRKKPGLLLNPTYGSASGDISTVHPSSSRSLHFSGYSNS
jgi:predicted secreted protein